MSFSHLIELSASCYDSMALFSTLLYLAIDFIYVCECVCVHLCLCVFLCVCVSIIKVHCIWIGILGFTVMHLNDTEIEFFPVLFSLTVCCSYFELYDLRVMWEQMHPMSLYLGDSHITHTISAFMHMHKNLQSSLSPVLIIWKILLFVFLAGCPFIKVCVH